MLLTIQNLNVTYGKHTALHITQPIHIDEGERIGIIGSNGAGKTTLVKSILGLVRYSGNIRTELKPEEIAVHMQFNNYPSTMPVKVIMETILVTKIKKNPKLSELIEYFEFQGCLGKRYAHLSGGQKQRLTIIMVMMQDAPLTFYDEVTSGLDFETRQKLMERLANWYKGQKGTVCMVSHYYEELELLADKLLILDQGRVVDFGGRKELFQKYCGKAIYIVSNNKFHEELLEEFPKLNAPEHLLAVAVRGDAMEERLVKMLMQSDIDYKKSSNDIEIMSINAKAASAEREGKTYEV